MPKKIDLTGERSFRLLALREDGRLYGRPAWLCKCDCGNYIRVTCGKFRSRQVRSCGCLQREFFEKTHGCSKEPWYPTYMAMLQRCGYWVCGSDYITEQYRGRGITVCDLWLQEPIAFGDWLLAHGWRKGLQIDRIDNDHGYCPENCRVVTPKENINNRRNTSRLDDGTSLAMFCSSIGINTCEGGKVTKKYSRIQAMWMSAHKPHPDLMQALKDDTDKQSRLLEITKLKCRHAELMIAGLKELLASKSDTLDNRLI